MLIYFVLIFFILCCPVIASAVSQDIQKRRKITVLFSFLAIYLLCALKASSVGIDIAGYKSAYELSNKFGWFDTSYIYFESGYILFEKIFSYLGFSFQQFMAIVYLIVFIPIAIFVYKYSRNITLSAMVYICYQTLIFNISGVRQSIATSICILAFLVLERQKIKNRILFVLLVLLASLFHKSAIIFLIVGILYRARLNISFAFFTILSFIVAIGFRSTIVAVLNSNAGKYQSSSSMSLGGNFIFLLGIMLVSIFLYYHLVLKNRNLYDFKPNDTKENGNSIDLKKELLIKMMIITVLAQLLFNGSSVLRCANYFSIFMIISIPELLHYFDAKSKKIYFIIVVCFMIYLFYATTLSINQFNCLPYIFFWQE